MTELAAFLESCIAADEEAARAVPAPLFEGDTFDVRFDSWESDHSEADREFVRRFDPARVLADCEALRAVVAAVQSGFYDSDLEVALEILAQPFAGRPGWRDEWGTNGHKEAQG